jgi:predicted nucleotidyltransferase
MDKYLNIINKFINKMNYKNNSCFLGVYFYGSCLTGFNSDDSDIDLHIIFDDSDSKHIFRGVSYIDGVKIEYFEKCISDVYLSVKNDIKECNWSWYSMIGNSYIVCDKNDELKKLQKYTLGVYKNISALDEEDIYEYISIINNRMSKLKKCLDEDSLNFYSLFYITVEKIRRFYHSIHGFPKINTSKIYKVYKDDEYRKSYFPFDFVSDEFKNLYLSIIENKDLDKNELFDLLVKLYNYVLDGRKLSEEFRIHIKSRNE